MKIKLIIWDWFDTLSDQHLYEVISQSNPAAYSKISDFFTSQPEKITSWANGEISFREIHREFARLTGLEEGQFDEALQQLAAASYVDPKLQEIVDKANALGVMQVIAADNFDIWDEFFLPEYSLEAGESFSRVYSNSEALHHPDSHRELEKFYRKLIQNQSVEATETLLIDDDTKLREVFSDRLGGKVLEFDTIDQIAPKLDSLLNQ